MGEDYESKLRKSESLLKNGFMREPVIRRISC